MQYITRLTNEACNKKYHWQNKRSLKHDEQKSNIKKFFRTIDEVFNTTYYYQNVYSVLHNVSSAIYLQSLQYNVSPLICMKSSS